VDIYTLDDTFVKESPIDEFTSVIWTERYNAAGDVTLTYPDGSPNSKLISEGTFLYTPDSDDIMLIDTIDTEKKVTKATGQTLTGFLTQRMCRFTWHTDSDSFMLTGSAAAIASAIVSQMCTPGGAMSTTAVLAGTAGTLELIPNLTIGTPAGGTSITVAVQNGNVYDAVKAVADLDNVGFWLRCTDIFAGTAPLLFQTYKGLDRTTSQSTNDPVIFSEAMDSFTDANKLRSIAGYKTVAYAVANGMTAQSSMGVAYAPGFTPTDVGFKRRTMMVEATDVNATDYTATDLTNILNQKAVDALANNNYVHMTDGQLVPQLKYVYGTHYNLGDIIELRADDDVAQAARVIEYVRSVDVSGKKAYPTLSVVA